jgi:hypothetical protein
VAYWDDIDEVEGPSDFQEKTMVTIFVNGTGDYKIVILPKGQKMNSMFFVQGVPPGGEHPYTLKLLIKTFDIKLFFTQRTLHWF